MKHQVFGCCPSKIVHDVIGLKAEFSIAYRATANSSGSAGRAGILGGCQVGVQVKIYPSVLIDGETVEVPGWAFVLAFAFRGISWAVKEADKPEFRAMVKRHLEPTMSQCFEDTEW